MKRVILFLGIFLILISSVSASFEIGNLSHQITTSYGPNENVKGWINMSFENEPINGLFEDSEGNTVNLIDLLRSDSYLIKDKDYSCSPVDCGINYDSSNGETSKEIALSSGEEVLVGFEFNEEVEEIRDVSFNLTSDAGALCVNQLKIDFLADGIIELGNTKLSNEICSLIERGCFESAEADDSYKLPEEPDKFCQRINLTESPGFKLGADINPNGDTVKVIFEIHETDGDLDDEAPASCTTEISGSKGEFYCNVSYLVTKEKEYYVCVYADEETGAEIEGYSSDEGCGFYYDGSINPEVFALNIFSIGYKFDNFGTLEIEDKLPNGEELSFMFDSEIGECSSSNPCVIPIKLISEANQNITIENISIEYKITTGPEKDSNKVYDVENMTASVSSNDSIQISLDDSNLTVPGQQGGLAYSLEYKGEEIFDEDINISAIPQIKFLSPITTINKFPTELKVFVSEVGNDSIATYEWDIDGTKSTTTENRKVYAFGTTKNYPVTIKVTDIKGRTSSPKTFNVGVSSYIGSLDEKINESANNLAHIKAQIENMSQFEEDSLKGILDLQGLNDEIIEIQRLKAAFDYEEAADKLLQLNIPKSIKKGVSTELVSFYPDKNNIRPDIVNAFQGDTYDSSKTGKYVDAIAVWHTSNLDTKVKYAKIEADYPNGSSGTILSFFEFKATELETLNYSSYIFLREMENLKFQQDYSTTPAQQGYFQIPFDSSTKTIKFSTTEEIDFLELPVFISPTLSDLVLLEIEPLEDIGMKWALFILFIVFLLIVGFIVYIFLQHWYKTKYETHLFKNRNYLFNLITYIQDSKKKGMRDSEIIKKLKKTGWNSEQITYVMKKYAGKRTGMVEIPVERLLGKFKGKKTMPVQKPGMPTPRPASALQKNIGKPQPKRFFKNSQ